MNSEPPDVSLQPPLPPDVRFYQGYNIGRKAYTSLKRLILPSSYKINDNAATRATSPMLTLTADK